LIYGLVFYGLSDVDVSIAKCLPQIPTEKLWTYCLSLLFTVVWDQQLT